MTAKFFVDTNVLVYAASNAAADQTRRDLALDLLDEPDLALSAQVLAEFYSVTTSKNKLNLTHEEAVLLLQSLDRIPACPITRKLVMEAVYSEDLNAGQVYDGVTVINPFITRTTA
jgi:predicted nucleic acid-binding protein